MREGVVAGLEPFIDTIVVCTLTALVILSTGVWQRGAEAVLLDEPSFAQSGGAWSPGMTRISEREEGSFTTGESVFLIVHADHNARSANSLHRIDGNILVAENGDVYVEWSTLESVAEPEVHDRGYLRKLRRCDADRKGV